MGDFEDPDEAAETAKVIVENPVIKEMLETMEAGAEIALEEGY